MENHATWQEDCGPLQCTLRVPSACRPVAGTCWTLQAIAVSLCLQAGTKVLV